MVLSLGLLTLDSKVQALALVPDVEALALTTSLMETEIDTFHIKYVRFIHSCTTVVRIKIYYAMEENLMFC